VQDLSFIKQNLRYPISRRTLLPAILSGLSLIGAIYLVYWLFYLKDKNLLLTIFLGVTLLIPAIRVVQRHLGVLKFISIPTDYYLAENMQLLQRFLEAERLIVFRHPEAPEVFQIISRSIDSFGDEREVLIFIADDKRILINSHFINTRKRYSIIAAQRHHNQMANIFKAWLKQQETAGTGVVRQRF